jgi:hypothetical protein
MAIRKARGLVGFCRDEVKTVPNAEAKLRQRPNRPHGAGALLPAPRFVRGQLDGKTFQNQKATHWHLRTNHFELYLPFNNEQEASMTAETKTTLFSKAKIFEYLKHGLRQKGGKRKAVVLLAIYVGGVSALLFATEETMRDTYGRSIGHVKGIIFFCLAGLFAYGVRDYFRFHSKDHS